MALKGTRSGPLLVLASPCFRGNVQITCKIAFWGSLDNFLLKNAVVFFFGNKISKWGSFQKRAIFDLLFTFLSHQGKDTKMPSHNPTYIQRILLALLTFPASPILQKLRIYYVWFLFGVNPGVDSFPRHFGAINK